MKVLLVAAHPLAESYHRSLRDAAIRGLASAGHEVDLCDLYAERFDPVLSADARSDYHDPARNQAGLEGYIARLRAAEAVVLAFPTWCFGPPAILKGFFDRLILPGVAFDIDGGKVTPLLSHVRSVAGIVTYGRARHMAWWMGDPPRKLVTRYLPWFAARGARVRYFAHYHMNVSTDATRAGFLARVEAGMRGL